MGRQKHFPSSAKEELCSIGSFDDYYGTHQYRRKSNPADVLEAFDHTFGFEHKGNSIVPLNIRHQKEVTNRSIRTLFLRKNVQYQHSAEVPDEQGVLISTRDQNTLNHLYPKHSVLDETDVSTLVALPNLEPVFQIKKPYNNYDVKVTDNRENLQQDTLLTSELRNIISNNGGEVVYESNPEHADRLVIAFQNFHGNIVTPWRLFAHHGEGGMQRFVDYQNSMVNAAEEIRKNVGNDNAQYILETLPGDPEKREKYVQNVHGVAMAAKSPVTQGLFGEKEHPWKGDFMNFSAALRTMNNAYENGNTIYGDARAERDEDFHRAERELTIDSVRLKKFAYGGVGAAAALNTVRSKLDNSVYCESHSEIIQMTSAHLNAGNTGIMIYGAGHFGSGRSEQAHDSNKTLEEYFRFMPNTQLVVVEMTEGVTSLTEYDAAVEESKNMNPDLRKKYFMCLNYLEHILGEIENLARLLNEEDAFEHPELLVAIPGLIEERNKVFESLQNIIAQSRHRSEMKKMGDKEERHRKSLNDDRSEDFIV